MKQRIPVLRVWLLVTLLTLAAGCGAAPTPVSVAERAKASPAAAKQRAIPLSAQPALAGCLTKAPSPPADARQVKITRVVDGDTFEVQDRTKVRLIGMNTPESVDPRKPVQAYAKEASAYTQTLLEGKDVLLQEGQTPKDRYGRTLAWVWLPDGRFVNALLVQEGYAQVYTFADNPDHADLLLACQREARDGNRGLWVLPDYKDGQQAAAASTPALAATTPPAPAPVVPAPGAVAAQPFGITITKPPGTVRRNATASVSVKTDPGASCFITVHYKSGPSNAQGLNPKQANAGGNVSWSWKVGGATTPGTWPITISCGTQRAATSVTVP